MKTTASMPVGKVMKAITRPPAKLYENALKKKKPTRKEICTLAGFAQSKAHLKKAVQLLKTIPKLTVEERYYLAGVICS